MIRWNLSVTFITTLRYSRHSVWSYMAADDQSSRQDRADLRSSNLLHAFCHTHPCYITANQGNAASLPCLREVSNLPHWSLVPWGWWNWTWNTCRLISNLIFRPNQHGKIGIIGNKHRHRKVQMNIPLFHHVPELPASLCGIASLRGIPDIHFFLKGTRARLSE